MEGNQFYTLPHQRSSSAAAAQHAAAARKRQSFSGRVDDNTEIIDPLLTSDLSEPTVTRSDEKYSGTTTDQTSLLSAEMSHSSEITNKKHQTTDFVSENDEKVELLMMPGHHKVTGEAAGNFHSLPQKTSATALTATKGTINSVPTDIHDSTEQLRPLMTASLVQPIVCDDGGERFHQASTSRTSVPYTASFQRPEEAAPDRYHSLDHASSRHLEPVVISGSSATPSQQAFSNEGTSAVLPLPHQASKLSNAPRFYSSTTLEEHSSPSHRANIRNSHKPDFTPGTPDFTPRISEKETFDSAGASTTTLPYHVPPPSSLPTTLQFMKSTSTTDSLPSTSTVGKNTEQEPLFTTRSSHSGSERMSDKISRQTSASFATPLHLSGLIGETHHSPTHTAEMMLSGGLPMNRRRTGASPESQHVTMRGTITRGNSVGQPVKVQLDLTETEFLRLTSQEPKIKEDFKCVCGLSLGPHIIVWSLLCIPVAIAISVCVAFYNGSMAWYNLIIYFSEEKTVFHKVVLCPVIILSFPVTVGVSALLISLVAAAMQISWSWHRWLAEIRDGEKGFYGWFCGQIGLPACSPYQVVVLDSSSV